MADAILAMALLYLEVFKRGEKLSLSITNQFKKALKRIKIMNTNLIISGRKTNDTFFR